MEEEPTYTVEKAEGLLPELRVRLERIRHARRTMLGAAERIRGEIATDGGGHAGTDYWESSRVLKTEIERLAELGILLRDPETGLVDFPGEREGRRIYLCWLLGEEHVAFWHETDSGLIGRKPL